MTTPQQPAQRRPAYQAAITDLPWPRALQIISTQGSFQLISLASLIVGWSVAETSGTGPFRVGLFSGTDTSGHRLATIGAAASGNSVTGPGWPGIPAPDGIYVSAATGAFHGAIWIIPVPGGVM